VGVTIESYGKVEISYINAPKLCVGDLIIIWNAAKTISLLLFGRLNYG
jgi:hypothetical protein